MKCVDMFGTERTHQQLLDTVLCMPSENRPSLHNRLLESLPVGDRRRLLTECKSVELTYAEGLHAPGAKLAHIYFPTSSFISLIMPVSKATGLEVGLIGNEGMFGFSLALGVDVSPVRAVVQGAGAALRMDAAVFRRALVRSKALHRCIDRYVFVQMNQLAQTSACTRFHVVEARLARWLLMTQDRAGLDTFHITQQFLAAMLGVRRVGVTKAASSLQRRGLIQYKRGRISVLDRTELKGAACPCYKADLASYALILG